MIGSFNKIYRKIYRSLSNEFYRKLDYFLARVESIYKSKLNINPLRLYYVDPASINETVMPRTIQIKPLNLSPVVPGEWDIGTENLEDNELFYSFEEHFQEHKDWEKTELYSRELSYVNQEKGWDGRDFSNKNEIKSYLKDKDKLFQKVQREGYRTQNDLNSEDNISFWVPDSMALERNEITVHVGRDGSFILEDGFHRLAIAKVLGLDKVPVRIAARHSEWQERREKLMNSENLDKDITHPDLVDLVKNA
jgi:hypothetical protein